MRKIDLVGKALCTYTIEYQSGVENVFALGGGFEVALGGYARKADRFAIDLRVNTQPQTTDEFVLDRLHVVEERSKVHDAGHIGIGEFDHPLGSEDLRHGAKSSLKQD